MVIRPPGYSGPLPEPGGRGNYRYVAQSQEEEDAFQYELFRDLPKTSGNVGSVAHLVKGALGAGILGAHSAWMKGGLYVSLFVTLFFGIYIAYCLYLLVKSAHVVYRRTRVPIMGYSDVGEAVMVCQSNACLKRLALPFRYTIDATICLDLFGSCATYQLIISKTIKQMVEFVQETSLEGRNGYPHLRIYMLIVLPLIIGICLILHLKWLAPFSIVANFFILICIITAVYYAFKLNPSFEGMQPSNDVWNTICMLGMIVFSMSCVGVVIPVTNNMTNPNEFGRVIGAGMTIVVIFVLVISLSGYAAYLDKCQSPITINFPLTSLALLLKAMIAFMIVVTHAINFWVPFNVVYTYIRPKFPNNPIMWELLFRAIIVTMITIIAIIFPSINSLMGFLGAFCLSNMAFVWPSLIELLVIHERPGFGPYNWKLFKGLILTTIGFFLMAIGSVVNFVELIKSI